MKKLNRKGFTLIELLAVIVILAIIVVVTVPTIINTIDDARVQSIWNLSKEAANSYDTMKAQTLLNSSFGVTIYPAGTGWTCIDTTLAGKLNLSEADVKIVASGGTAPTISDGKVSNVTTACSAIQVKADGATEIVLIAKENGKFWIAGHHVNAYSGTTGGALD